MVRLSWSNFLKNQINSNGPFGLLIRCEPNVDQEAWPCTKKQMCWMFFQYLPKKRKFNTNLLLRRVSLMGPRLFSILARAPLSFASPTAKPIGACQWVTQALTYAFWRPQTSWSLWHIIYQPITYFTGLWDNFMVHGVNNPLRVPANGVGLFITDSRSSY